MEKKIGISAFILFFTLTSCGVLNSSSQSHPTDESSSTEKIDDMSGVSFNDVNYTYDSEPKAIGIMGDLPSGVSVSYENNVKTDAGVYEAIAHFTGDSNYDPIDDMTATLTINKADIPNISFGDSAIPYDGQPHSIYITSRDLPTGVSVVYTNNEKSDSGTYVVTAHFTGSNENYNQPQDLTAKLMIYDTQNLVDENGITYLFDIDSQTYIVFGHAYEIPPISTISSVISGHPVVSIYSNAFSFSSLTSITIPYSITSIGQGAFTYCISLTSVTIPNSVTTIGGYAFSSCESLVSIMIPSSVTSLANDAFYYCTSLASIVVASGNAHYASDANGVLYNQTKTILIYYPSGRTDTSFSIPNSVTSIGVSAFYRCTSLTLITIPTSVTTIGVGAFDDCSSLTSITIPNSVTSIGDFAFDDCSSLESIAISSSITSIGDSVFQSCDSLESVTIPSSVTSIGVSAFYSCSSLTSVAIPNGVTSIGGGAFLACHALTSVTIPSSVTSIGDMAFSYCGLLTSITIPSSVALIGNEAFYGCSGLTIYCRAPSMPSGWSADWNSSNRPVVWGYVG